MNGQLEVYRRKDRRWAWRLVAANGQVVATDGGQGYERRVDARRMAQSILAGTFAVVDLATADPPYDEGDEPLVSDDIQHQEAAAAEQAALGQWGLPETGLLQLQRTRLHGGACSWHKIDCDALTSDDLAAAAAMLCRALPPFGVVEGVPRGGLALAAALEREATSGPLLIVDDVCTTGGSLEHHRAGRAAIGAVLFARGPCPEWVVPLFTLHPGVA